jgi:Tfp pilus assembly protein PilV
MADIDLIPRDYRTRIWLQSRAKRTATVIVSMLVIAAATFAVFSYQLTRIERDITTLQKQQAITTQQREALTQLNEKKTSLDNQLKLLNGLRGGASASTMFVTMDQALTAGDIWFQDWEFQRAGSSVEKPAEPASNGYFIILPASSDKTAETWKIETHMKIRGQARDHSTLSRFVRRLFEQPEIQDIRILNTSLATNREFVNFNLIVTVNSNGASS